MLVVYYWIKSTHDYPLALGTGAMEHPEPSSLTQPGCGQAVHGLPGPCCIWSLYPGTVHWGWCKAQHLFGHYAEGKAEEVKRIQSTSTEPWYWQGCCQKSQASTASTRELLQEHLKIEWRDFPEEDKDPVVQMVESCMLGKQEVLHILRLNWVLSKACTSVQTFSFGYNWKGASKERPQILFRDDKWDKVDEVLREICELGWRKTHFSMFPRSPRISRTPWVV